MNEYAKALQWATEDRQEEEDSLPCFEVDVIVTVAVSAKTREDAEELAREWVGVADNADPVVSFVCAEVR